MLGSEILTTNFHLITYLAGQKLERDRKILRGGGGELVPQLGIEPLPCACEASGLTTEPP